MPPPLRALCSLIWQQVLARFNPNANPNATATANASGSGSGGIKEAIVDAKVAHAARTAVSGVLFLRFLVPAIVAPAVHGVLPEAPARVASRGLVLVSKVADSTRLSPTALPLISTLPLTCHSTHTHRHSHAPPLTRLSPTHCIATHCTATPPPLTSCSSPR